MIRDRMDLFVAEDDPMRVYGALEVDGDCYVGGRIHNRRLRAYAIVQAVVNCLFFIGILLGVTL